MDSFDDLLAPSRAALEANPFHDPFAPQRSGSPDPWASPFADQPHDEETPHEQPTSPTSPARPIEEEEPLGAHLITDEEDNEPPPTQKSVVPEPRSQTPPPVRTASPTPVPVPVSPPKTKSEVLDDDDEPLGNRLGSAGFRESIAEPPFSEIATIRPTEPEETIPAPVHAWSPVDYQRPANDGWRGDHDHWSNERSTSRLPSEDDSDDDKPIGQIVRESSNKAVSPQRLDASKRTDLQPVFIITVDDPQKVGDPIRSFTMYTVHTRTTSPLFQKSAFSVLRRYSDFLWLYETLSLNNPGVVVPPVPEKNPFGRFDDQFVKQRRLALEKCIQKIANHPELGKDPDLKMFLESDSFALDIKQRKAEIAHERGGLMASIGQTLTGPRFVENDDWFDKQKSYLDGLEAQLRGLVKAIELVAKQRLELSMATGEFAQTVGELSQSDVGKQLAYSLAGLADVERQAQELQSTQADQDISTFMSTVDEYARLINSVRLAFHSRIRTYQNWKNAENESLRVKQTHERNRAQGKISTDRLGFSLNQIADAERRALEAKHEFEHVSKLAKSEVARFERERVDDFKDSMHAFLEGMISRQKELIAGWENYQQILLKRVGGGRGLPDEPSNE